MAIFNNSDGFLTIGEKSYNKFKVISVTESVNDDYVSIYFDNGLTINLNYLEHGIDNGTNTFNDFVTLIKSYFDIDLTGSGGGSGGSTSIKSSTSTKSTVNASNVSVQLLGTDSTRNSCVIYNDSSNDAILYISKVSPATINDAIRLYKGGFVTIDNYVSSIYGIWSSANAGKAIIETDNI